MNAAAPKTRVPQPFFCDKRTSHKRAGGGEALFRRSSDLRHREGSVSSPVFSLPGIASSDRFSPKTQLLALTAAVPFGIYTRLSCSAEFAIRKICHGKGYLIVEDMIAQRLCNVKWISEFQRRHFLHNGQSHHHWGADTHHRTWPDRGE